MQKILSLLAIAGVAALLGTACAQPQATGTEPQRVERAWADVQRLTRNNRCTADDDCRSIAVGSRACGGPSSYLAWSSKSADEAALNAAVQRHAELVKAQNTAEGRMSTCQMLVDPGAECRAQRCELKQP